MKTLALRLAFGLSLIALAFSAGSPATAEEDPRRPAAIETTGVPVIDDAVFSELAKYQNVRGAGFAGWAPSGDGILIRTRFANTVQLHRVIAPGSRREQITFFEEPVGGAYADHTDDVILLSKSAGGNEQNQVYRLKDRELVMLTDGESRNSAGPVSPDGGQVVIQSTQRNGRDTDTYITDLAGGGPLTSVLETDGEYWYASDWSPDGKTLAMVQYVSANESYLGLLDLASQELTRLWLPGQEPDSDITIAIGGAAFDVDGKSVLITSDLEGEFQQLGRLDPDSGTLTWLTDDIPWSVEDVVVHHDSGRIAFTVNEGGSSALYLIENGNRRKLETPLAIISSLDFSPDGSQLGMTLSRPDNPSDAYSIDLATGELSRWTYSEMGGLDPDRFITPTKIEYESFDARTIPAYYYRPATATESDPAPVVIQIHGGPEGQYRPYFSPTNQFLATELGVAVVAPNVRGSAGYGKTYLALDNAEKREDSVRDIGGLLEWIAEQPELDADRVMVWGGSYGGYMVLASLSHYPDRIAAGIDVVGIANFITFLERTKPYRRDLRRAEYGDERDPEMRAVFERINPTARAGEIRSPLLVVHGVNDPRVPFFEAQQIAEKVRSEGVPVWTVYAENEGHGFAKKDNRDYLSGVEMEFVKRFLVRGRAKSGQQGME